ncbi:alpha-glucan family phosphorylase [Marinilabilia rubra]|uniref:Alpha-glucan family phosphorylase n=1 Tax=Marinilabilia rubra TaxID=2162893 RepID=A0A2U2B829_9BACT|nr:alpha-glucan family phosphorylase [Marinilabilia rubra]PWD99217.1 alpha-glucan family phosphorylase [Marinilabilia rubra]
MMDSFLKPDFVFETSWEVCNKTGGIHTVLASKAKTLADQFGDQLVFIGPDVWRGPHQNPEFIPDHTLFAEWQEVLKGEGLRVKTGRWNIPGTPIVFLVDFSPLVARKNEILARLWESFKLDSLSGQWDYVEPALFGYAAGMVIDSYYRFYIPDSEKVVAHFNEWMTGSGALYLRDHLLQIGTVFTTHATVVGRALAGKGALVYEHLNEYDADSKAGELNVVSKHSMEKVTAGNVDCFTTVSDITSHECARFLAREVDVVTPNGFDTSIVPSEADYQDRRNKARERLIKVTEALLGIKVSEDAFFIANSGRYEYRNKGADVFLDVLKKLNEEANSQREILAFVLIPANTYGPRKDLMGKLKKGGDKKPLPNPFLTHGLNDIGYDPIINKIQDIHLSNEASERVKLIFVPSYLNGDDGIFDIPYYDLLLGMDLTVFPSYYEPWGYTPQESVSYGVPAVTTTLAGFGLWASKHSKGIDEGVEVVPRNDKNYDQVVTNIASVVENFSQKSEEEIVTIHSKARKLGQLLEWESLIKNYYQAYDIALKEVNNRRDKFTAVKRDVRIRLVPETSAVPGWKKLVVKSRLPERIKVLHELTRNLWWAWNYKLVELFETIDPEKWEEVGKNPVQLLDKVSFDRLSELASDDQFVEKLDSIYAEFREYMDHDFTQEPRIAYFSMEYGLSNVLKIYSGGLGILAGDYLKEASDRGVKMVAVGLLYRFGYFTQTLSINGEQSANYEMQDFSQLPLEEVRGKDGQPLYVFIELPGRSLYAKVWKAQVGRVSLYLMDTDTDRNTPADRQITHQLYGGDWENRLKQEILLGLGGIRLLQALDAHVDIFHANEGHAALINVERLVNLVGQKYSFAEAMEIVRASSLFTTHTPVPAGHDKFEEDMFRVYLRHIPEKINISWEEFMDMGREHPGGKEKFSMSVLAAKTSQEMNGVSLLHGDVSKKMFQSLWRGYFPEELHVDYVTNGVHYGTWTVSEWQNFYREIFGEKFLSDVSDKKFWKKIYDVPDEKIWEVRHTLRKKLMDFIRYRLEGSMSQRHDSPGHIVEVLDILNEDALTIGFARRFATYKRAHLLFRDLERLSEIVNNSDYPVQFIFAGKAHPADEGGQALIKHIVEISKRPEFVGKIIFLENYDMELAKRLVSGVDVWLNTPTRPLEASGTSGQKAELNGVLNFSVLDGWWYEGFEKEAGWSLTERRSFENQDYQDDLDAATIYSILENEIIPLFYDVNEKSIPEGWVRYIKNSIAHIAPQFTTRRMIDDYLDKFYNPMFERLEELCVNECALVHEIASWKRQVSAGWDSVELVEVNMPDIARQELGIGDDYIVDVTLNLKKLEGVDVGLEMLILESTDEEFPPILHKEPFKLIKKEGAIVCYEMKYQLNLPGSFKFGIRMFPRNKHLPHQQDFGLVRWF